MKNRQKSISEPKQNHIKIKNINLEALRGVLALMVVIGHVELIRLYFGRSENYLNPIIFHLGRVGVTGFFVLSGYLISLTILKRKESGNWSIGRFYRARIRRIWPLYFFIIFLAIIVLPQIPQLHFIIPPFGIDARNATSNYWYFLFLMPQVPPLDNCILPFAEPTWSIGVEEIFYLVIPWLFIFSRQTLQKALLIFIAAFLILKYFAIYYYHMPYNAYLPKLMNFYRYDCISLGCLMALLHFNENKLLKSISGFHFALAILVIVILFKNLSTNSYDYFPFAICFGIVIMYFVNQNDAIKSPKWLAYIGTVSYSLYLSHEIVIVYFINLGFDKYMPAMYVVCVIGTILLASVLYYLVEKPFLEIDNSKRMNN